MSADFEPKIGQWVKVGNAGAWESRWGPVVGPYCGTDKSGNPIVLLSTDAEPEDGWTSNELRPATAEEIAQRIDGWGLPEGYEDPRKSLSTVVNGETHTVHCAPDDAPTRFTSCPLKCRKTPTGPRVWMREVYDEEDGPVGETGPVDPLNMVAWARYATEECTFCTDGQVALPDDPTTASGLREAYSESAMEADDGSWFVCSRCMSVASAADGGDDEFPGLCSQCWCDVEPKLRTMEGGEASEDDDDPGPSVWADFASLAAEQAEALGREWLARGWKWAPGQRYIARSKHYDVRTGVARLDVVDRTSPVIESWEAVPDPRDPGTLGHAMAQGIVEADGLTPIGEDRADFGVAKDPVDDMTRVAFGTRRLSELERGDIVDFGGEVSVVTCPPNDAGRVPVVVARTGWKCELREPWPNGVRWLGSASSLTPYPPEAERERIAEPYLRALAACYLAVDPMCPANEDGTGEWAIDDVVDAVREQVKAKDKAVAMACEFSRLRDHLAETGWLVAEAFGADRDCSACQKVVRHMDRRELGTRCSVHGGDSSEASAGMSPKQSLPIAYDRNGQTKVCDAARLTVVGEVVGLGNGVGVSYAEVKVGETGTWVAAFRREHWGDSEPRVADLVTVHELGGAGMHVRPLALKSDKLECANRELEEMRREVEILQSRLHDVEPQLPVLREKAALADAIHAMVTRRGEGDQ